MSQGKKNQPFAPSRVKSGSFVTIWTSDGTIPDRVQKSLQGSPIHCQGAGDTAERPTGVRHTVAEDVYFIPCQLQVVPSETAAQYRVSEEKALAVYFPNSDPQMGMFRSTVAYLLSHENAHPCPWEVVNNKAGTFDMPQSQCDQVLCF